MRTYRTTNRQTDTSTDNKGRYKAREPIMTSAVSQRMNDIAVSMQRIQQ